MRIGSESIRAKNEQSQGLIAHRGNGQAAAGQEDLFAEFSAVLDKIAVQLSLNDKFPFDSMVLALQDASPPPRKNEETRPREEKAGFENEASVEKIVPVDLNEVEDDTGRRAEDLNDEEAAQEVEESEPVREAQGEDDQVREEATEVQGDDGEANEEEVIEEGVIEEEVIEEGVIEEEVIEEEVIEEEGAYRVAKRLQAVLLNGKGKSSGEISEVLSLPRSCVSDWLRNYEQYGDESMETKDFLRAIVLDDRVGYHQIKKFY